MEFQPLATDAGQPIPLDIDRPFHYPLTVSQEDCDAQNHVNNAVYIQWMDKAAYAHSSSVGYDWKRLQELCATFVVRRHEIDYLAPTFANDRLVVATWPCVMKRFNATRRHQIVRLSDGITVARAHTQWIYLDTKTGRPKRMPEEMILAFEPRDSANSSS